MKNPKARKRKCAAAVACTVLLARIRKILRENIKAGKEWQEKPSRRGQGEARGMVRICEELLTELRVMGRRYHANTKLSGGGLLSNKTTEAESRRPLE